VRSLRDLDVARKRVFVRADLNVPLEHGVVTDATRIDATLPTLHWILQREGKLIIASHLGRPKGKPMPELSLKPVADVLAAKLGRPVTLVQDCVGAETERVVAAMQPGEVVLL
jgi:phosphoglycerate kinase